MQNARNAGQSVRVARGLTALALLAFPLASACADELGGDGWTPPPQMSDVGGDANGLGGGLGSGGIIEQAGAGGEAPAHSGKGGGGSGGKGGGGGKPPTGGGTENTDAGTGTGGETTGSVCGNGSTEPPYEDCDDGNTTSGDACPANCRSACETCEKTFCKAVRSAEAGQHGWALDAPLAPLDPYTNCFDMPGLSAGGLAPGIPRADLCQAVVDCVRREQCQQFVPNDLENTTIPTFPFLRCYCDLDITSYSPTYPIQCSSPDTLVKGKCWREFQEASELNDSAVFGNTFNGNIPFGASNVMLLACDKKLCQEECFPESSSGAVAELSADILWTANPAGESPLGDLIADAHRSAMGTDFALLRFPVDTFLGGYGPEGLRVEATPGRAADGTGRVLESELDHALFGMNPRNFYVHQFTGDKLVTLQLTGQQLYDTLNAFRGDIHVSGLSYTWDDALPSSKVTEIRKGGVAIDKTASYSVTVNNVTARSIVGGTSVVESDKNPFRETIAYLKALPQPVAPPTLDRVTRLH